MSTENTPEPEIVKSTPTPSAPSAPSATAAQTAPSPTPATSNTASSVESKAAPVTDAGSDASELDWIGSIDEAIKAELNPEKEEKKEPEKIDSGKAEEEEPDEPAMATMTKAARAAFKQLKADLKTWKQKASELEKQQVPQKSEQSEDYEQLKSKLDEYEREIAVSRVESSKVYKEVVVQPLNGLLSTAYGIGERYQIPEATLEAALAESDPAKQNELLEEVSAGFSQRDKINFFRLVDDIDVVMQRRREIMENAREAKDTLLRTEQEQTRRETSEAYENVWKTLSSKIPLFTDSTVASDVRNKAQATDLASARADVRAYAAYAGAAFPHLLKQNQSLSAKVAQLEKTISSFRNTVPKPGKGHSVQSEAPSEMGFLEALEAGL